MTRSKQIALSGVLAALALALSLLENLVPLGLLIPLPGVKLGLANIVTLVALYALGPSFALGVLLCRIATLYLATGNFTSLAMSLAGALCSFLAMWLCSRLPRCFSIYGVSLIGAAFHNLGQIGAACLLMRSTAVVYYLPLLLYACLVTGSITGAVARLCLHHLPSHR